MDCQNLSDIKQVIAQIEADEVGTLILRSPYDLSSNTTLVEFLLVRYGTPRAPFRTIAILENNTQQLVTKDD